MLRNTLVTAARSLPARLSSRRPAARKFSLSFSELFVPEHLRNLDRQLAVPMDRGRCMIVGRPAYKYPIAVVPPPREVAPLMDAIRECEHRPFRIISYADEAGRVFNCSFFNDEAHMRDWIEWLSVNALTAESPFHECMVSAAADVEALPTPATLLFGRGTSVLTDTRFGEYQVGMSINFSRQVPLDDEAHADMCEVAASAEFEARIARCMHENNVSYFGRLAMLEEAAGGGSPPALLTALRYGSIDDARRGTAVVREQMLPELTRWFGNEHASLLGTTTQVLEL